MTLEVATYINQLNSSYPEGGADRSTADDHLRLIKATVLATFPSVTGPVTVTHTELNLLAGATTTLASVSALTTKYSLSISANTADIARISQTVSVLWAKVTSISALNTQYSLSISQVKASISALTTSLNSVSVVLNADLHSVSAAIQVSINAISNTVSVMAVRINTLSVTVAAVQTDVARISVTVSAIWTRINTLSVSVSLLTTYLPTLATVQTASGASVDFPDIPSWVKRITIMMTGLSYAAAGTGRIQLGVTAGLVTSGYSNVSMLTGSDGAGSFATAADGITNISTGAAASAIQGSVVVTKLNGNIWKAEGQHYRATDAIWVHSTAYVDLGDTLTSLSLVASVSTFDAGTVNIMYE